MTTLFVAVTLFVLVVPGIFLWRYLARGRRRKPRPTRTASKE